MSELIDRQALKAAHGLGTDCGNCKQSARSCQYDRDFSRMDFCEWIDDTPTIDAVPVVHGEWINMELGDELVPPIYKCSACESKWLGVGGYYYCPNCGALMDRKEQS